VKERHSSHDYGNQHRQADSRAAPVVKLLAPQATRTCELPTAAGSRSGARAGG
jgi:hypothetical protein